MNKIQLILITAVLRTENLPYILENLVTVFKNYKDSIEPMWVLSFDKYNATIDNSLIHDLTEKCVSEDIRISVYYQGDPDKENYGGTLFNLPLQDLKNHVYQTDDPFVYILDDDNILSSYFPQHIIDISKDTRHKMWWTNMIDEFGSHYFSRHADALAFREGTGINEGYRIIHPCASLDPSGMILKLDFLLSLGGFETTRDYDYKFMSRMYNDSTFVNTIGFQANNPWMRNKDYIASTTYHNGLVKRSDIEHTIEDIKNDDIEDSYIKVHNKDHYFIIPLNNKQLKEILKIAKNYKI